MIIDGENSRRRHEAPRKCSPNHPPALPLRQSPRERIDAQSMKGQKIEVLVDRPADRDNDKWVARATFQAPDIDSVTLVHAQRLYPGQILDVNVSGSDGYDLVAELSRKSSRGLKVVAGA
jgi:tRNA A37 methylthiotransferase MiaB